MKPSKNYSLLTPFYSVLLLLLAQQLATAQNVGIGTTTPNANAALEIRSSNKGLLIPRLSTAGRIAMANVAKGMMVYDTTASAFYYHDGSKWRTIAEPNLDSTINTSYPGAVPDTAQIINDLNEQVILTTALTGYIFDDGGPNGNYTNNCNTNCYVYTNNDSVLFYRIEVQFLSTQANVDKLEIFYTQQNSFFFSGTETMSFNTHRPNFRVKFSSDGSTTGAGFRIKWTAVTSSQLKVPQPPLMGWHFDTKKMAGRAGFNIGNVLWNTDELGKDSYAFGNNAIATGKGSFAFGNSSKALGDSSFTAGIGALGSKKHAVAIGASSEAGDGAVAVGVGSNATGKGAIAIGDNAAYGERSIAVGFRNYTSGNFAAVGIGWYNTVPGNGSVCIGADNYIGNTRSFAIGTQNTITAEYAAAMGTKIYIPNGANGAMGLGDLEFSNNPVDITSIGYSNQLVARFRNGYYFITSANAPGGSINNRTGVQIGPGGNSWSAISDSRRKENFIPVDGESILQKIAAMPLTTWNYKAQDPATMRHYGPMAQDFFAAFGKDQLGLIGCDTLINQQDFLGINLSAIQALEKRTAQLKEDNIQLVQQLTQEIMLLKKELEAVKKQVGKKED
jgi:hypothetical protein